MGPRTRRALRDFQLDAGLDATGLLDQGTSEALARDPVTADQGAAWDAETEKEATGHADVPLPPPQSDTESDPLLTPSPIVEDERQEVHMPASVVVAPVSEPLEESDVTDERRTSSQERIPTTPIQTELGPFRRIAPRLFARLLRRLGDARVALIEQAPDGVLLLGHRGERLVEHYSFFAVFQTPEEYRIIADTKSLGSLPVVMVLAPGMTIIFSGRRWRIVEIHDREVSSLLEPRSPG